jgi:hypothetical protein
VRDPSISGKKSFVAPNGQEPEAQMLRQDKTPQIINQSPQLPHSPRDASHQIGPVQDKKNAELRQSQPIEGLFPSSQIGAEAESTSGEYPRSIRDRSISREKNWVPPNGLEPEAQMPQPEKTLQIINEKPRLPHSPRDASHQIGPVQDRKNADLRRSQSIERLFQSGKKSIASRAGARENFNDSAMNRSSNDHSLKQPSSWTNDERMHLEYLDDGITGLFHIEDLHKSSDMNSSSESDGDDLSLPSSRRSAMAGRSPNIKSSEQNRRSRINHSPGRQEKDTYTIGRINAALNRSEMAERQLHIYQPRANELAEGVAIARKLHLSPRQAARKLRKAFSQRRTEEFPDEKTASSVRVTIGRIEVRAAIAPEKPAEKSRSKVQILSLDDYLRLRNGGQR